MKRISNFKIGISGFRGIIGDSLDPEQVVNLTRAFATLVGRGRVAVAQDSRPSGEMIKRAVCSALIFSGITPVDTLILPTPSLEIFVKHKKLNGGIIITASHNPDAWNGLKFVDENGLFISPFMSLNLIDIYHQRSFLSPAKNEFPEPEQNFDAFKIHKEKIFKIVDVEAIRKRRFRVLADPGGGVGVFYNGEFLEELGCHVEMIHTDTQYGFPREPEPTCKNLTKASESMRNGHFDVGFAQDPDGDRLSLLDETGVPLDGELTLATALWGYLSGLHKKGKIVVNLSTSRVMEYVAEQCGFKVLRSAVGEINVAEMMIKENAAAGGEGNGGIMIPRVHCCRDSFTGMALVLETLAKCGKSLSQIVAGFPKYKMITAKIPLSMTGSQKIISLLREKYRDANLADGIRVSRPGYWFHVRPSNTEPVLRIVAEGSEGEIEPLVAALTGDIQAMVS